MKLKEVSRLLVRDLVVLDVNLASVSYGVVEGHC